MSFNAVILAGGLGTRLREAVPDLPKVLAPVNGRPFLCYVLDRLADAGCSTAVLAVGYGRDVVRSVIGARHGSVAIKYSEEQTPLGTGGAAAHAAKFVSTADVVVLNGDTFAEVDYCTMLAAHRAAVARVTVAVKWVDDVARFGAVDLVGDRIVRFKEKGERGPGLINAGVYVFDTTLLASLDDRNEAFSLETDVLHRRTPELTPLAFITTGRFVDIGVPDDYRTAWLMLQDTKEK